MLGLFEVVPRKDALVRQLDAAIWLWFFEREPLAVHLIAMAAYQCLCDLREEEIDVPLEAYDWLRHGSTDKNERVNFSSADNSKVLWNATISFLQVFHQLSPSMRTFQLYFLIKRREFRGDEESVRGFMPYTLSFNEVHKLSSSRRRTFWRKLSKRFVAENPTPVTVTERVDKPVRKTPLAPDSVFRD